MRPGKGYALWMALSLAGAIAFGIYAAPHMGWIEAWALWCCIVFGREATKTRERQKADARIHHHHAMALRSAADGMEAAARLHGPEGIHTAVGFGEVITMLREVANQRDKGAPAP